MSAFSLRILESNKNKIHKNAKFSSFWKHEKKEYHKTKDTNIKF